MVEQSLLQSPNLFTQTLDALIRQLVRLDELIDPCLQPDILHSQPGVLRVRLHVVRTGTAKWSQVHRLPDSVHKEPRWLTFETKAIYVLHRRLRSSCGRRRLSGGKPMTTNATMVALTGLLRLHDAQTGLLRLHDAQTGLQDCRS